MLGISFVGKTGTAFFLADSLDTEGFGHDNSGRLDAASGFPFYASFDTIEDVDLSKIHQKLPFTFKLSNRFPQCKEQASFVLKRLIRFPCPDRSRSRKANTDTD